MLERSSLYSVVHRTLPFVSPEAAYLALFAGADREPRSFWLDSGSSSEPRNEDARFSFMGGPLGPHGFTVSYRVPQRTIVVERAGGTESTTGDFFAWLEDALAAHRVENAAELPFACGLVGWLGYELKAETGGQVRHVAPHPDAKLVLADRMLAFDHVAQSVTLIALHDARDPRDRSDADAWIDATAHRLEDLGAPPPPPMEQGAVSLRWSRGRDRYLRDMEECHRCLRDGETYEICLTDTLHATTTVSPLAFHRTLRRTNPAPHAALLQFDDVAVVSASPERFLAIERDGSVETKPIKGTAPRGATPDDDARAIELLRTSEKMRSENLMVVDLLRNDLGRVCEIGSVEVPRLMDVETFPTLHQLVSTVRGRLRPDVNAAGCVRAAFPGGSMTGAPKVRTMQILDRLETEARGIYSGALGYFSLDGAAQLSIVIRSAVFSGGEVTIGVGGAIIALSDPAAEHDEIVLKAHALVRALLTTAGVKNVDGWTGRVDRGRESYAQTTHEPNVPLLPTDGGD